MKVLKVFNKFFHVCAINVTMITYETIFLTYFIMLSPLPKMRLWRKQQHGNTIRTKVISSFILHKIFLKVFFKFPNAHSMIERPCLCFLSYNSSRTRCCWLSLWMSLSKGTKDALYFKKGMEKTLLDICPCWRRSHYIELVYINQTFAKFKNYCRFWVDQYRHQRGTF